ncbi:MAG TPA: hypothetical protein VHC21_04295 [Candidatus Saccharimonadales bacterium]|nr:hypothetical protein [Candidatus Saccharimonadales bacterium]
MEMQESERPLTAAERGFDIISAAACLAVTSAATFYGVEELHSPYAGIRQGAIGAGFIALSFAGIGWHKLHHALWPQAPDATNH